MANRRQKPVIPFDYEIENPSTIEYIRHQFREDDDIIEERIPKLREDASPYEILHFLNTFQRARTTMSWTTGPKLYQKFQLHLSDYHLEVWYLFMNDRAHTVVRFDAHLKEFKTELLQGYSYEDQMDYLRSLKKPGAMEPSQFLLKLRAANRLATQLSNRPAVDTGFNDLQLKRVFLAAMPKAWQENFENANLTVHNTIIQDMRTYMDRQSIKDPFVPRNNQGNNNDRGQQNDRNRRGNNRGGTNRGNNRGNNQGNGNNNGNSQGATGNRNNGRTNDNNGNNNQGNGNRNGNNNNRNNNRIQNTDPCPLPGHGGHTWGQCRANRFNDESQRQGQGQGNQNQGNRYNTRSQGRQNQGQNHNVQGTNVAANEAPPPNTVTFQPTPHPAFYGQGQGQSFVTTADTEPDFTTGPESFFSHDDDLEIERYGATNVLPSKANGSERTGERDNMEISETYTEDLIPTTLATAKQINSIQGRFVFRSLLDHGESHVMVHRRCLPANCETFRNERMSFKTTAGSFQSAEFVSLTFVSLPEFSYTRKVTKVNRCARGRVPPNFGSQLSEPSEARRTVVATQVHVVQR